MAARDPVGGRSCIILNPAARGARAARLQSLFRDLDPGIELRPTTGPGAGRVLARDAVEQGCVAVYAAGGDGTVFDVLNGITDVPGGLERTALGVIPLGTANVLAHELRVPMNPLAAWQALRGGSEHRIDCGFAEFRDPTGAPGSAHFAIVAGAGLDARAVEQVNLPLKRKVGKLAYVVSALTALVRFRDEVVSRVNDETWRSRAFLAGNGRLYAGDLPVFAGGSVTSGCLHLRSAARVGPGLVAACLWAYATGRWSLEGRLRAADVAEVTLEAAAGRVPLQLDGEFAGWLPARLRVLPRALRVLVPGQEIQLGKAMRDPIDPHHEFR